MRSAPTLLALATFVTATPVQAQTDECPVPIVAVRSEVNGQSTTSMLELRNQPDGGMVNQRVLHRMIDGNRRNIRFAQGVVNAADSDFILTAAESGAGPYTATSRLAGPYTATLRLEDQKGRTVVAPSRVEFTSDQMVGPELDVVARRLMGFSHPLLPVIRAYQHRVREERQSAIYALLRVPPEEVVVQPDRDYTVRLELVDCDEGNPPLGNREIVIEHAGVGGIDRTRVTTDADGKAEVVFRSSERGVAKITTVWPYENTAGQSTIAHSGLTVRVQPAFGFSRVSVSSPFPDEPAEMGSLWVLSNDLVELTYPESPLPAARTSASPACADRTEQHEGGVVIPMGRQQRFGEASRASGKQRAGSVTEVTFDSVQSARVRITVSAHGEPEPGWEEEDGSEVEAGAAFDLIVDVENPDSLRYALAIDPQAIRGSSAGSGEYALTLWAGGTGCNGRYSIPWTVNLSGSEGVRRGRGGRGARLTVNGDPHVELLIRVSAVARAWGGLLEPPYDGDAEVEVDLRLTAEPLPND